MAGFFGAALSTVDIVPEAVATDCSDSNWALDTSTSIDLVNNYVGDAAPGTLGDVVFTCLDGADIQPLTDLVVGHAQIQVPGAHDPCPVPDITEHLFVEFEEPIVVERDRAAIWFRRKVLEERLVDVPGLNSRQFASVRD